MDYSKLVISPENKEEENKILVEIYDCIKKSESLVFDAGAGSGKTYSLIETLKYIIAEYGKNMKVHNQKIMCITYTNVAANEIKKRLENTSLVSVGTIHENLWGIIKIYQKQLVQIHKYNLMDEIEKMKEDVKTNAKYEKYRNLSQKEQEKLIQTIYENIEEYYKNKKAEKFREVFSPILNNYGILKDDILKNVGNFKYVINNLIKINKYKETVEKIDLKDVKFINIEYDVRSSNDKLEKMKISHDTLLLYSYKIIEQNDLLKQFIIDMYPFILIDEYQDTSLKVIELLACLESYSRKINHNIFLGYFGDVKQNIYDNGVGKRLFDLCPQLKRIKKIYNRRSAPKIIEVANKIRNDDINQKTIYSNFPKGTVSFYNMDIDKKKFIDIHVEKWNITEKNKLHCLELKNEFIVEQLGFKDIYNFFKEAPWYRWPRSELLKDHLLNSEITKIGEVQNLLFKIVDLRNKLKCRESMISEIFEKRTLKNRTLSDLKSTINKLKYRR
ncbi:MAG: UvrD-helicase domain-containing protein [Fusobacteriales bacterium]|nr:UvrD-helicase domain-containing protein [Fusobacteriales bacterium]